MELTIIHIYIDICILLNYALRNYIDHFHTLSFVKY